MIKFDIITIFPEIFYSYFQESIIARAEKKKLIKINIHNLRDFTVNRHRTVDDKPFGGGPGMVFKIEPIYKAAEALKNRHKKTEKRKVILLSAKGKKFTQKKAYDFSKLEQIILICGRYEGVDERVAKYVADEEISIGDYVLTGGELPAMIIVDVVSRLIPGVIKEESLKEESFLFKRKQKVPKFFKEYPQYTRPAVFSPQKGIFYKVPKVLLSGDHSKIEEWRKNHSEN